MDKTHRYCVIDLSGIYRQHWHATEHKHQNEAMSRTLADIEKATEGYDDNNVVICCDTRAPTFRHELSEEYKAHRAEAPAGMYGLLRETERKLEERYHVLRADGYEADDVCATVCAFLSDAFRIGSSESLEVELVSTDKDLRQCVTDQVTWVSPRTLERLDPAGVREKHGVSPGQLPHLQALMGDRSDGYPGVKGIGPAKGAPLVKEFYTVNGIIDALEHRYTSVVDVIGKKTTHNLVDAVRDGSLQLGLKLATLKRGALDDDALYPILGPVEATGTVAVEPDPEPLDELLPESNDDEKPAVILPPDSSAGWVDELLNL